jgi:hypothetical protein
MRYINALLLIAFMLLSGYSCSLNPDASFLKESTPDNLPPLNNTNTPSPITEIQPTQLPQFLPNNGKETLSHFVMSNGGCKLPCIMGLTPGEGYKSVEEFGNYFILNAQQSNNQIDGLDLFGQIDTNSGGGLVAFWDNHIRVQIGVGAHVVKENGEIDYVTLSASVYEHFVDKNGIPFAKSLQSHPYFDKLLSTFSLANILEEYGEPTEILIYPFPEELGYSYNSSAYPFVFVLVYKNAGFAIEYISLVKEEGEYLIGCPDVDNIKISSWVSQTKPIFGEISRYFSGMEGLSQSTASFFKPLNSVTSLTVIDFYNIYRVHNENNCIQTSKQLWH